MKKYAWMLIFVLALGACNLPQEATPTPDLVATAVSVALTNAPTSTPIQPSETPMATFTSQPTLAVTPTPTQTASLVPTETATPSNEDPAVSLGDPTYVEEFDTPTGTWNYEDEWFSLNVNDGHLNIYSKGTPYWNCWYTIGPAIQNFYLEATLTMPNCNGKDRVGLAFRLTNQNQFYFMGLTCDATWGFSRYTASNGTETILEYTESDFINPTNETNRIGVMANGSHFTFYINGTKVGETDDTTYPDAGSYGFVTMSAGTVNFKTSVDVLKYWLLP
jgi:hypothetical protein